jgi:membrane-associated phospholipid phosphatase
VLEVKPGEEAIKNKDLYEKTGYWHPFVRMPRFILDDQKKIGTSPFHTAKKDIKWWVIFGGATAALIATDQYTKRNAPDNSHLVHIGTDASQLGESYTLLPIAAGFYFLGSASSSERFRETDLLSFEALADTTVVQLIIKSATDRARPLESDRKGHFWDSTSSPSNSGFPSGHAINTFAMASVFAHEYHSIWVKVAAYGYAGGVMAARLAADKHFPGDAVAGGVLGWFIGDYVYGKRHNAELDHKSRIAQRILQHVQFGVALK